MEEEILFNLEIQIEDDKTANIVIRENDDIDQVVNDFCRDNGYSDNIKSIIMSQIVQVLDNNIEELEGAGEEGEVIDDNDDNENNDDNHENDENDGNNDENQNNRFSESRENNRYSQNKQNTDKNDSAVNDGSNSDEEYNRYMNSNKEENTWRESHTDTEQSNKEEKENFNNNNNNNMNKNLNNNNFNQNLNNNNFNQNLNNSNQIIDSNQKSKSPKNNETLNENKVFNESQHPIILNDSDSESQAQNDSHYKHNNNNSDHYNKNSNNYNQHITSNGDKDNDKDNNSIIPKIIKSEVAKNLNFSAEASGASENSQNSQNLGISGFSSNLHTNNNVNTNNDDNINPKDILFTTDYLPTQNQTQTDLQTSKSFSNFVLDKAKEKRQLIYNTNVNKNTKKNYIPSSKLKSQNDSSSKMSIPYNKAKAKDIDKEHTNKVIEVNEVNNNKRNSFNTHSPSVINRTNNHHNNIPSNKNDINYNTNMTHLNKPNRPSHSQLPGERLYTEYFEKLPRKIDAINKIKEQQRLSEMKEVKFKPEINFESNRIASISPIRKELSKVEDRLIKFGEKKRERIIKEKSKRQMIELDHPYYPAISDKSKIMASIKRRERLNTLNKSNISTSKHNKTSDDIYEVEVDMNYYTNYNMNNEVSNENEINSDYDYDDRLHSDEELNPKYKEKTNPYSNNNVNKEKITNNNVGSEGKEESFVSSDYTFTNMKAQETIQKVNNNVENNKRNMGGKTSNSNLNINNKSNISNSKIKTSNSNSNKNIKQIHANNTSPSTISRARSKTPNQKENSTTHPTQKENSTTHPTHPTQKNNATTHTTKKENSTTHPSQKNNSTTSSIPLNPEKNIHDFLYLESKLKDQKKTFLQTAFIKSNYSFKPTIPDSSKKLITRTETKEQFIKRLLNSKKEAEELIVKQKQISNNKIDNITGKPYFKPTVSRGPKDPKTREVTVNLDGYYDNKLLSHKIKAEEEETLSNLEKKKMFLQNSMKSILKMKIESYKEIFDLLDSDRDGFISSRNIKLSSLDSDVLNRLTPILEDLQQRSVGNPMSFKEFCIKADKFLCVKVFSNNN